MLKMLKEGTTLYDVMEYSLIVGGISLGLSLFKFDLLGFVPEGIATTVVMAVIGLSGVGLLYVKAKKNRWF